MTSPTAELYVLGLLYIAGDMESGPVLTRQQISDTGWMFANVIGRDIHVEPGDDDTYFKFRLSEDENSIGFRLLIGPDLRPLIDEIQFGYYHHRAIFKFRFRGGTSLPALRDARAEASQIVRDHCFDAIAGKVIPPADSGLQIEYVYSYSLLVVPNGAREVASELTAVRSRGYDDIFTVRSTTFGLHLPGTRAPLASRRHYVRISVPSTVIYLAGERLSTELLGNVIDAIYYGGLYHKAQLDFERSAARDTPLKPADRWTNDLLLRVFSILVDSVRADQRGETSMRIARLSAVVALVALVVSLGARLL